MLKKMFITVLVILFLPIAVLWLFDDEDTNQVSAGSAVATSKPQIIKFTSTRCSECKEMNKVLSQILPKYENKFTYKEIVVDKGSDMNNELIRKYHVTLVPTLIMFNSDGTQHKRIVGSIPVNEMENCIKGLK